MQLRSGRILQERCCDKPVTYTYAPSIKYNLTQSKINKYYLRHPQSLELDGKYYNVLIDPYTNVPLQQSIPLIGGILSGKYKYEIEKNAVYVYVLLGHDKVDNKYLYLMKVNSAFEFGTKHHQLVYRVAKLYPEWKKIQVYYSGELHRSETGTIAFNFFSGTFHMEKHIKEGNKPSDMWYIIKLIKKYFGFVEEEGGQFIYFTELPLIEKQSFSLREELEKYKSFGAIIYEFTSEYAAQTYRNYFNTVTPLQTYSLSKNVIRSLEKQAVLY